MIQSLKRGWNRNYQEDMTGRFNEEEAMRRKEFMIKAAIWAGLVVAVVLLGGIDYLTGNEIHVFVFYFIPVTLAAIRLGLGASVVMSVLSALAWAGADAMAGHEYVSSAILIWNMVVHLCVFLFIGVASAKIIALLNQERVLNESLKRTLAEVKVLEGLLPICAQCKKIRNEKGAWQQLESYIQFHSGAQFTHGMCPDCGKKLLAEAGLSDIDLEGTALHE